MAYIKKTWKDYPDTSTPIKAEDLNNIEDRLSDEEYYVTATAGSNGDFRVTLSNTTLTTNRVVKIAFPTATNPASNARLSIDGGTTYKNINSKIGSNVQNKCLNLKYNGTEFEDVNQKHSITLQLNADFTQSSFSGGVNVPMSLFEQTGTKLTLSSGGVKVGQGVSKVKVSSNFRIVHSNASQINTYIMKNGVAQVGTSADVGANARITASISPKDFSVEENDLFIGRVFIGTPGNLTVSSGEGMTYFTVEVVE